MSVKQRRIGLTGGIGAGKSTVAELLRKRGIVVVDLDLVGRELLSTQTSLTPEIVKLCGPSVVKDGTLDRGEVRKIVFNDPVKRDQLETLLHPLIIAEFEKRAQQEFKKGTRLVVCEAALLVEGGYHRKLDGLVVVSAPESMRRDRVVLRDGISEDLFEAMVKTQAPDKERQGAATYLLYNDGDSEKIESQVETLYQSWKAHSWV